jgi:hypothetical protein
MHDAQIHHAVRDGEVIVGSGRAAGGFSAGRERPRRRAVNRVGGRRLRTVTRVQG